MKRVAGVIGVALAVVVLWLWQPLVSAAASLAALMFALSLLGGCLMVCLLVPLVEGRWQALLLPEARRGLPVMPFLLLMLVPLLIGVPLLYSWAGEQPGGFRGVWLSPWAFRVRALAYVAFWCFAAWRVQRGERRFLPALLIVHVVVSSLAAVDWQMSLSAEFNSAVFGLLIVSRQLLDGLAVAGFRQAGATLRGLLVAALAVSLYLFYMQYLVIWSVNLPHELAWYQQRATPLWQTVGGLLFASQMLSLLVLLTPLGQHARTVRGVCVVTVLGSALQAMWLTLPSIKALDAGLALPLTVVLQAAYGGLWFAWRRRQP